MPIGTPAIQAFNHIHSMVPYTDDSPIHYPTCTMKAHIEREPLHASGGVADYIPATSGDTRVRFIDEEGDGLRAEEEISEISDVWKPRKF